MWYHDFADYCLESIAINRLIGDLDNSAANKTILLLQVLKVMLMPSADYQFNRSLQCASKIASASDLRGCGPCLLHFPDEIRRTATIRGKRFAA